MNESLLDLTRIGFSHSSGAPTWAWRYAKQLLDHACTLCLAKPFDFGRGKGKYITDKQIEDVAHAMRHDHKAVTIAARFHARRLQVVLEHLESTGRSSDIKKGSVLLADLEHELQNWRIPYTIESPRWGSDHLYVSIKRQEATI